MSKLLDRYFKENFFLIPIRKNEKRPLFKKWNQYSLSYMEAKQYLKEGYNLGVVAKDLWILDYDQRVIEPGPIYRNWETLIQFTPRGYHVYLRGSDPLKADSEYTYIVYGKVRQKPDTIRHGDMYALVAPSKVDGKSYWWLDSMKGEILTL